jgi:HB1/ASXL restriction endonuclease-like protein with HTH domain
MQTYLDRLKPGTRFRLAGMPEVTGTLIDCTDCSANVRVDGGTREVEFENEDGATRRFSARRATTTTWAPATVVEPIFSPEDESSSNDEEFEMATKKTSKKAPKATKAAATPKVKADKPAKKAKTPKEAKEKKLSAIDAAAQVLAASKEPMNAKEMIEAMAAKELWTSPGGKTPHATLYSAIIREIATKGKESRFVKKDRGQFAAN